LRLRIDPPYTAICPATAPITRPRRHRWRYRPRTPLEANSLVDDTLPLLKITGSLAGHPAIFLVDCGANNNFVDSGFAKRNSLSLAPSSSSIKVADGHRSLAQGTVLRTRCAADTSLPSSFQFASSFEATPLSGCDAILGLPWFNMVKPQFSWDQPNSVYVDIAGQPVSLRNATPQQLEQAEQAALTRRSSIIRSSVVNAIAALESPAPQRESSVVAPTEEGPQAASRDPEEERIMQEAAEQVLSTYSDVFPDKLPSALPPSRGVEHYIELIPGATPTFRRAYRLSIAETKELKVQLDELEKQGFIQRSKSPYGAPVMFVKKKDGTLRLVVDYRMLNNVTIKNRYPLPLTDELFDLVHGARYFSKIDLRTGFYQIKIADNDREKTAFLTRYGSYEFNVLPMGLCNAPATFMHLMNHTFKDYLDDFIIVFLDDILVFSKTLEDHKKHVALALERLRKSKLYAKKSKCELFKRDVEFLGHRIGAGGLRTLDDKVKAVCDWPALTSVGDVRRFMGLVGYYRKFIKDFSGIALPLTELTKSRVAFTWGPAEQEAFAKLKETIRTAPVLTLPDPKLPYVVHTDASGFAVGAVLQQDHGQGLQPVAYLSKKMLPAETRYPVHEQELLAIVHACQSWRHYLLGTPFRIMTDHKSLQHFLTQPMLSGRQARWKEVLANYDFTIEYVKGAENEVADGLSRRGDHRSSPNALATQTRQELTACHIFSAPDLGRVARERRNNVKAATEVIPRIPNLPAPNKAGAVVMPSQRCTANASTGAHCKARTAKGQYCWNHLRTHEQLRIKRSSVPRAGMGLFAERNFKPNEVVAQYTGDRVPLGDDSGGPYYLALTRGEAIDAARTNSGPGRWANDPRGTKTGANVRFCLNHRTRQATLRANKHIPKGSELLVKYGASYWNYWKPRTKTTSAVLAISSLPLADNIRQESLVDAEYQRLLGLPLPPTGPCGVKANSYTTGIEHTCRRAWICAPASWPNVTTAPPEATWDETRPLNK
jgi:hypothetical protein